MIKKTLPDDIFELSYDERDNLKSVKNKHSEISFEYELRENGSVLAKEMARGLGDLSDLPQSVLEYNYDESGNRIETITSEGSFYYLHDELNRLTKITNHKNEIFDFSYDLGGRIAEQRSPASVTSYQFDNVNFLTEISHKKRSNANVISNISYVRDQIDNITQMTNLKGNFNFVYDNNSQLINATNPEDLASIFSYDSLGNRITDRDGNYVYDNKKQKLVEDWKFTYVYDNNGNLISKVLKSDPTKIVNYNYNSQNQLIALKEFDGVTLQKDSRYFYDALGRRVAKYHSDNTDNTKSFVRKYIYDGQEILFEVNGDNDLLTTFTHSMLRTDDVLAMDKGNASYFYLKDHLGSINEIIDSSGNIIQSYSYSAFGKILATKDGAGQVLSSPMVENFYTFTGRESDFESGLNYYRARYYEPALGRFIQADPHPGIIKVPASLNKYSYVLNSPQKYKDPSGKIVPVLIAIGISAAIGGTISALNGGNFWQGALIGAVSSAVVIGGAAGGMALFGATAGGASGFAAGAFGGAVAGSLNGDIMKLIGISKTVPTGRSRFIGGLFGALGGGVIGLNGIQGLTGSYSFGKDAGGSIHDMNSSVAEGVMPEDLPISNVEINMDFGPAANKLFNDLQNINLIPSEGSQIPLH